MLSTVIDQAADIADAVTSTRVVLIVLALQITRLVRIMRPAAVDLSLLCEYFKLRPARRTTAPIVVENGHESGPVDSRS